MHECLSVITSGSLVKREAFEHVCGFNESLFIDQVDHEFCYRLKRRGWRILKVDGIALNHNQIIGYGSTRPLLKKKILWFHICSWDHNHIRRYYMARNGLFVKRRYPEFARFYWPFIVSILGVIILEDYKAKKLRYTLMGVTHYFLNHMGKLPDPPKFFPATKRLELTDGPFL